MICCVIAAYLYARLVAVLRRWGIYWGLVRRGPYDGTVPTLFDNLRGRGPGPALSTVVVTLMLVGLAGAWSGGALHAPAYAPASATVADHGNVPRLAELIGF